MNTNNNGTNGNLNTLAEDTASLANWFTSAEVTEKTGLSWTQIVAAEKKGLLTSVSKGGQKLWHVSGLDKMAAYAQLKAQLKAMENALLGTEGDAAE
jgi:hypothetical protein